jgi:hypothetical protein
VTKSTEDVTSPLYWCCIALRQIERTRESDADYRGAKAAGIERHRLDFLFWGDYHFLISATHHMNEALKGLSSGPKMPKRLRFQIEVMRHTLEHWDDAPWAGQQQLKGRWKTLAEMHGESATPSIVAGGGDIDDLLIGPDRISLQELEQELGRVRDELLEVYNPEDYDGSDSGQLLALLRDRLLEEYGESRRELVDKVLEVLAAEPELLLDAEQAKVRLKQALVRPIEERIERYPELLDRHAREGNFPPTDKPEGNG